MQTLGKSPHAQVAKGKRKQSNARKLRRLLKRIEKKWDALPNTPRP
jgi:hypothetical protein